ncbi:MAG: glucokinase [Candidatus Rokubacteria bacterium]|nr:glucokinase [Candidatus Rokubacteria bacterium]
MPERSSSRPARRPRSLTILAGDVGGTKTALALFEETATGPALVREEALPSRQFPSLEAAIGRFLEAGPPCTVSAACFGVAGAVVDGRSFPTNLPWELDEGPLAQAIPAPRVKLINDLEAAAHGVLHLPTHELLTLQEGSPRRGNMVLIAAGTGLGEALLVWDGKRHSVVASEGGHGDFAPRSDLEIELLRFLTKEFERVSYERVLSGPGLFNIYRFLRESGYASEPQWLRERIEKGDPSEVVSEAGLAGRDPLCMKALELFVSIYGAEAGNLALKALAVGGVFVGGGIAPKIRAKLADGTFIAAFRDKGRLSRVIAEMPVRVALNPRAPLLGAARVARQLVVTG